MYDDCFGGCSVCMMMMTLVVLCVLMTVVWMCFYPRGRVDISVVVCELTLQSTQQSYNPFHLVGCIYMCVGCAVCVFVWMCVVMLILVLLCAN